MEQTNQNRMLGEEKISKLLVNFSIPSILSLLRQFLYPFPYFHVNDTLGWFCCLPTDLWNNTA